MSRSGIKEVDVLRALLGVWQETCVHPKRMALRDFIRKDTPEIRYMDSFLCVVIIRERLLLQERSGRSFLYRWNDKAGPPTYLMAKRILLLTRQLCSDYSRAKYKRNKQQKED